MVKTEVQQEAIRIWQTVPGRQWKEEVAKLPEFKVIFGVRWPYRQCVQDILTRAWILWKQGSVVVMPGMTAELKCVGVDLSERVSGNESANA